MFYTHFKEGRGVEGLRIFRAIKAELVWWAKDPEGNVYTGELVEVAENPIQPPIPAPCGNQTGAAGKDRWISGEIARLLRSKEKSDHKYDY